MVAIVAGNGLGLERTSGFVLGSRGQLGSASLGRTAEGVFVNAATGNLIITGGDEMLFGLGSDSVISRSYNSLGTLNDDNGDNWRASVSRKVAGLTGTVNTSGSTITRTDWDGSEVVYTWDATRSAYVSKEGAGAFDTLTYASNVWTWKDGNSRVTEAYDNNNGGRITSRTDLDGNTLTFSYNGSGLVSRVTTTTSASVQEYTDLTYSGTDLVSLVTSRHADAAGTASLTTLTRVTYGYDISHRLTSVTVDLTPTDNSVSDNVKYVTSYTYDGTSRRVASITQTDGTSLAIAYDGSNRVSTLTQTVSSGVTRVTSFAYSSGYTTVTDPAGQVTTLNYDSNKQLTSIVEPAPVSGGTALTTSFTYDSDGNVLTVSPPSGKTVTYGYDSNGNVTSERDYAGNTITRTYGSNNQLLTETRYLVPDPDGAGSGTPSSPVTTNYLYDSENHLRFVVTPEGYVNEYRYDTPGNLISVIQYTSVTYASTLTESAMATWVSGLSSTDKAASKRTDTTYDFRGNVASVTSYEKTTTAGAGDTSGQVSTTSYVYDQTGNLLNRIVVVGGTTYTESFVYDGLNRLKSSTDFNSVATTVAFNDSSSTTAVTLANGLVQTSTYNLAGELISYAESGSGYTTATSSYRYDVLGRVRAVTDPNGNSTYFLYDRDGRKTADIAADGAITEYGYNADGQLISTVQYQNKLTSTQLSSLTSGSGDLAVLEVATVRPSSDSADRWTWKIYDNAGRLIEVIDGTGAAIVYAYDGASRLVSTTAYANKIASGTVTGFKTTSPTSLTTPTADSANDRVARAFYDNDGRVVGTLDGEGYLTKTVYDKAGQKIETIAFATRTSSTYWASGTFAQLLTSAGTTAADLHAWFVYDDAGRLRYTLDANLRPTEIAYDALGNAVHTIAYAGQITSASSYDYDYVLAQISINSSITSNAASNRTSRAVYDILGRKVFGIDAIGGVTQFAYDNVGKVTKTVQYGALYTTSGDPSLSTMTSWVTSNASSTVDRVTRAFYDLAGKPVYAVDAEGYVTEHQYDAEGQLTKTIRYAEVYTVTDSTTKANLTSAISGGAVLGNAAQTQFAYDIDGRLTDTTNAEGVVTHLVYNTLNQVTDSTVAYGTSEAVTTHFTYDGAGNLSQEAIDPSGLNAVTGYAYNAFGKVTTVTDPRGNTVGYTYDRVGNVLTSTVQLDGSTNAVTTNQYDAFGNLVKVTDPRGNAGFFYYDKLNRVTLQVDPEGYATETAYSIGGQAVSVKRYYTAISPPTVGTVPSLTTNAKDATTTITRDKLDRVIATTDAEGFTEGYATTLSNAYSGTYGLNAFGDRLFIRNKLGGVTTNTFDKRGLLLTETLPVSAYLSSGSAQTNSVTSTAVIINKFTYDARGNRTQMIEAYGLTEARTTNYQYDKLDRLTVTAKDAVTVTADNLGSTSSVTPTETIHYDKRGNVDGTVDAAGAKTFYYYDKLDRKIGQLDALGNQSEWTYDLNGNALTARVYGSPQATLPTVWGGAPPTPVNPTIYRQTTFTYDKANRQIGTSVAGLLTGQYNGSSYVTTTGAVTTSTAYDASGNVIQQADGRDNAVFTYYDKRGKKVAQVDQEKYLTTFTLDTEGNVVSETRYATKLTATATASSSVSSLIANAGTSANDRTTVFTYDKVGQRLTEKRTGVTAYSINSTTGALSAGSSDAIITYTYNGLGEVTRKTEATGDYTDYVYDVAGRQTSQTTSAFTDYTNTSVQRRTTNAYDGLNNLIRSVVDGVTTTGAARVTTFAYGAGGRMTSMTQDIDSSTTFTRSYGYDAAGRVVKEGFTRTKADGTTVTQANNTRYDLLGRAIYQAAASYASSTWTFGDASQVGYNTYGEVAGKGINVSAGAYQETFEYDAGGRLWRTNSGDGTIKLFLYDAAGNATMAVTTVGADLSSVTLSTLASYAASTPVTNTVQTITVFDKRSQATETREPSRTIGNGSGGTTSATIIHTKTYNAFGEVLSESDGRGNVTEFAYNTVGKVIEKKAPQVSTTAENGAITTNSRPTESYYYDLSGRLIGVRDANNYSSTALANAITTRLLAAHTGYGGSEPTVIKEFHTDGGIFKSEIDVFGDVRKITNEIGYVETRDYDEMGRLITVTHPTRVSTSTTLVDHYEYDELGQRIRHWNSQFGSSVKEKTEYDIQGRVISTTDYLGYATGYNYVWSGSIATSGLATFGGWTKTTTTTSIVAGTSTARTLVDSIDYFGRQVGHTDMGGRVYSMGFDKGGRKTSQSSTLSGSTVQNIAYTYHNTGQLATSTSAVGKLDTYTYTYDADGRRISEKFQQTDSGTTYTYGNGIATFDAMGRMATYADASGPSQPSIVYEYDSNGNVRRMATTYLDPIYSASTTQEYWYKYDAMNRFVVTKASFTGSRGSGTIGNGLTLTYNAAGQRMTVSWVTSETHVAGHWEREPPDPPYWVDDSVTYTAYRYEEYAYTEDGYLATVKHKDTYWDSTSGMAVTPSTAVTRVIDTRDALGRVTNHKEYQLGTNVLVYEKSATFDNGGKVTADTVTNKQGADTYVSASTYDYLAKVGGSYTGAYQGGELVHVQTTLTKNGSSQPTSGYDYAYEYWDGAKQDVITYKPDSSGSTTYNSVFDYNESGFLTHVDVNDGRPRDVYYLNDAQGQITRRWETSSATNNPFQYYYVFAGQRLGDVGNRGPSELDYATTLTKPRPPMAYGPFKDQALDPQQAFADFDQSYSPISPSGTGESQAGYNYTLQGGESLQAIAEAVWGDAALWYLIADANGLTSTSQLTGGMVLIIPNKVTNVHNNVSTFKVYDPNKATGNVQPNQPPPPPKAGGGCGIIGQFISTIIAVVVTTLTGNPVLGNIASQFFNMATGLQEGFNWKSLAMTYVTAGVTAGLDVSGVFGSIANYPTLNAVVTQATASALTQGIAVATGLQDKFSWNAVAAAGVVAGVSSVVAGKIDAGGSARLRAMARNGASAKAITQYARGLEFTSDLVSGAAGAIAGAATRSLLNGGDFGDNLLQVLPDVLASTIGRRLASDLKGRAHSTPSASGDSDERGAPISQEQFEQFSDEVPGRSNYWDEGTSSISPEQAAEWSLSEPSPSPLSEEDFEYLSGYHKGFVGNGRPFSIDPWLIDQIYNFAVPLFEEENRKIFTTNATVALDVGAFLWNFPDLFKDSLYTDTTLTDYRQVRSDHDSERNWEVAFAYKGKFAGHVRINDRGLAIYDTKGRLIMRRTGPVNWDTLEGAVFQENAVMQSRTPLGKQWLSAARTFTGLLNRSADFKYSGIVVPGVSYLAMGIGTPSPQAMVGLEMAYEMRMWQLSGWKPQPYPGPSYPPAKRR